MLEVIGVIAIISFFSAIFIFFGACIGFQMAADQVDQITGGRRQTDEFWCARGLKNYSCQGDNNAE